MIAGRFVTLALIALASPAGAQVGTLATVSGTVVDMSRDAGGQILYCTESGDVGRIDSAGNVTLLASGFSSCSLVAVTPTPSGDIAVLDKCADIYEIPSGGGSPALVYSDLYIINDPTDLIVDASGVYMTAAQTATSGVRALQWVDPVTGNWAYYLIDHTPVGVVADPIGGRLILSDTQNGGSLRRVNTTLEHHPTSILENTAMPGYALGVQDGDLACEDNGDVLSIAGGDLLRYDRSAAVTQTLASGLFPLKGLAIASSSGAVASSTGWSAYLAQASGPNTLVREVGGVRAPADVIAAPLGTVPGRGKNLLFFAGLHAFDMEVDADGHLLVSGDQWGSNFEVRRYEIPSLASSTVAGMSDGLPGRVEAVSLEPSGNLLAITSGGQLLRIEEGGSPTLTTLYTDPFNLLGVPKDLALDRSGNSYIGNYFSWSNGSLVQVNSSGLGSTLLNTEETRGVSPDPFTGDLLLTEWKDSGFNGDVDIYDPVSGSVTPISGLNELNFSNAPAWGDGKTCQDVLGNIYLCSEDDFSLLRFDRDSNRKVRIGSGYTNHPTGVAIARSTGQTPSTTGWSLFVAEWNFLWEIGSVPPPAPRLLDAEAPPVGRTVGWIHPSRGEARALGLDPASGELLVSTSLGFLESMNRDDGETQTLVTTGTPRDMVALAPVSSGEVLAASDDGRIFEIDPATGYQTTVLHDLSGQNIAVTGLAVDGADRPLLVGTRGAASELLRVDSGLEPLAFLARGRRAAIDPLTAEVFVSEAGPGLGSGGEVMRVDAFASPARAGHVRHEVFRTYAVGELDGDLVFDDAGNFYLVAGDSARVWRYDRANETSTLLSGNYDDPRALVLAPGTPGTAGPQGTSLFVLDGNTVYEIGVPGLPAPPPPAGPGAGAPADLVVHGSFDIGTTIEVSVQRTQDAGLPYWILPSLVGQEPGLPLALLGDPSDPRVIPSNYSDFWGLSTDPGVMPGFVGVLDGSGQSPAGAGLAVPNDPVLLGADVFLQLTWIALDPGAQSGVATVGGTAQIFVGD